MYKRLFLLLFALSIALASCDTFRGFATVPPAACKVTGSMVPTPNATEVAAYPAVGKEDWVLGPADALITFIEYGDYQ